MTGRFVNILSFQKARPNSWIGFNDPTTGYCFEKGYKDFFEVMDHVRSFREANNIPLATKPFLSLEDELQAYFCSLGHISSECVQNERYMRKLPGIIRKVASGSTALAKTAIGGKWVPQDLAERRAAKCLGCPFNDMKQKFILTDEIMKRIVETMTVPVGEGLGVCAVCHCPLKPKVWFPIDVVYARLSKNERVKMRQGFVHKHTNQHTKCWQVAEIDDLLEEKKNG